MTQICKEIMRACRHVIYHIWMLVKSISNETVDIFRIDITIQMDSGYEYYVFNKMGNH